MTEAAPATAPAVPDIKPDTTSWFAGADPEIIGHIQTKGWATKPANEAAIEAVKAHREAEKFIGAPANQLVRLPADAKDEAGWKSVWERLGAPADPKGYDLSIVKDTAVADFIRETAAALHLPKDAAVDLAGRFTRRQEATEAADVATKTAALETEKAALAKNWGTNAEANRVIAQSAARALGITPETVAALEGVIGYSAIMEMFRSIGTKIGEDKFVKSENMPGGVMTLEQAKAKVADLQKDAAWRARYLSGGEPEKREMLALNTIIAAARSLE